jgi:hypothetical protein
MTVIKRAPKAASADVASDQAATKAAAAAPDSGAKKKANVRGKRTMFSVGFESDLLEELDTARGKVGLSRPAYLKVALRRMLDAEA